MSQNRSISQRLAKAKSPESKEEAALDWAQSWEREQLALIAKLEQGIKHDNYDDLCIATGQLKAVSNKKFEALPKVITKLIEAAHPRESNEASTSTD